MSAWNYRRYRYCRFLSSAGTWSVDHGAHIQAFTFSSQDHGRLSMVPCVVWCGMCGVRVVCVRVCVRVCVCVCWHGCAHVMCVVVCTLCCGVVCSVGGLWCGVVLCCFVWRGAAWHAENPSVCRFKTPPCASMCTRKTPACSRVFPPSLSFLLSLFFLSVLLSFSSPLSSSLLSFSLSTLVFSLSSLSNNDNDHSSSPALSVYTRLWLALWARVHVPWLTVGRTCSYHITAQASCHLEWSGSVSVLEMGDV